MIYDLVSNAKTYKGISRNLDFALDYLGKTDLGSLPVGKHSIDGTNVMANVSKSETKKADSTKYEAHKKYIDIQIVLSGRECCYCTPITGLKISEPFNVDKDVGTFEDPAGSVASVPLLPGTFAILFPNDAHKPSCDLDGKAAVVKVVMKVAVDKV